MHSIQGAWHWCAEKRTIIILLVKAEASNSAVVFDGRFHFYQTVRRGGGGGQMFKFVFNPFDRFTNLFRGKAYEDDVRKNLDLDAKTTARPLRCPHPQLGILNPKRHRHYWMRREWPLIVRRNIIKIFTLMIVSCDDKTFKRGLRIPRITNFHFYHFVGLSKGIVGVAIGKIACRNDIAAHSFVHNWGIV